MRKTITALAGTAAALLISAGVASAEHSGTASPAAPQEFCATLISGSEASGTSSVLAESCSEKSRADAENGLRVEATRMGMPLMADTPLVIFWEHAGFSGVSNVIYGGAGPCDRAGYRIEPVDWWEDNLSSIQRIDTCDRARITNDAGTHAQTFVLDAPSLGSLGDDADVVQVYSSYWP